MNISDITEILVANKYPQKQAEATARELSQIDKRLLPALKEWLEDGTEQDYRAEEFTLSGLKSRFGMTYPAALLTIDWLLKDPGMATEAINHGIK